MRELGVYVHVPFCNGKCAYCDFVSGVHDESVKARYFAALRREIAAFDFEDRVVDTVYFGGGTPSSVDARYIAAVLDALRARAAFADDAEITVECNPESLTAEKARIYAEAGVNRLSLGLQAADDRLLKTIGRLHTVADFRDALAAVRLFIDNISADLMLGLPGQTADDVRRAVALVMDCAVRHVSAYALKIEPGTPLAASGFVPDDDLAASFYEIVVNELHAHGYARYEVSNFALPGYECRHNMKYWRREEYKGFGIAAHSFVNNYRTENTRALDYLDGVTVISSQYIDPYGTEAAEETLMLALRTAEGLDFAAYERQFGIDLREQKATQLSLLSDFVAADKGRLQLTDKGFYVMNEIIVRLID